MFNLKYKYMAFILTEFWKYFDIGGHCGLCGKWVETEVVSKQGRVTVCDECIDWKAKPND
jgi:hypothetical protein